MTLNNCMGFGKIKHASDHKFNTLNMGYHHPTSILTSVLQGQFDNSLFTNEYNRVNITSDAT